MPIRRSQTHSGVILHVLRPTEKDADVLRTQYSIHPLDISAMLEVQTSADASRYHHDHRLQLCLPWVVEGRIVSCDVSFIWNDHQAIIVHDTPEKTINETLAAIENISERTPLEIVTYLLLALTKRVEMLNVSSFPETRTVLQQNWQAIERLLTLVDQPFDPEYSAAWHLALHRLKHLERQTLEPRAISTAQYAERAPKTVMGFATASVFVFVSVLWALH